MGSNGLIITYNFPQKNSDQWKVLAKAGYFLTVRFLYVLKKQIK